MDETSGRTALLRATIAVVADGGLRALTYRAVAAAAGVSHGLVRHHFGSRDQLIAKAMDYAIAESLKGSNMRAQVTSVSEFAAGIETLAKRDSHLQAFQYELLLEARRRPELQEYADRHYASYRAAIYAQLQHLRVPQREISALTDVIWFALDGLVFKQLVCPQEVGAALREIRRIISLTIQMDSQ